MTAPTRRQYADADRLLRAQSYRESGDVNYGALELRCWIADTKPERRPDLWRLILGCIAVLAVAALILGAAL